MATLATVGTCHVCRCATSAGGSQHCEAGGRIFTKFMYAPKINLCAPPPMTDNLSSATCG